MSKTVTLINDNTIRLEDGTEIVFFKETQNEMSFTVYNAIADALPFGDNYICVSRDGFTKEEEQKLLELGLDEDTIFDLDRFMDKLNDNN